MPRLRLAVFVAFSVEAILLSGCGGSPAAAPASQASASNLSGNWLLAGSLSSSNISATIDVIGNNLNTAVSMTLSCQLGLETVATAALTGTVSADGSFTLSPSGSAASGVLSLSGKLPSSAGGAWQGNVGVAPTFRGCTPAIPSGTVSASQIAPVTGTYTGSFQAGTTPQTINVKAVLTQGETIGGSVENLEVTGTLMLTTPSCSTTASFAGLNGNSFAAVEGASIVLQSAFADGSGAAIEGYITSSDASHLSLTFLSLQQGSCLPSFFTLPATLTRQ